ncbi:MAG: hypothetical protein WCS77_04625 [Elusimicrobiaceae bacterium]|jgi:tRNA nucleotidyltransferase/poly(A) polymerase
MIEIPAARLPFLREVGEYASSRGVGAWVVGGCVRDWYLQRATKDIDIVTESPAVILADFVAEKYEVTREIFGRFGTCRLTLPDGTGVDFARARTETYSRPAALPDVRFATINSDLKRRDFSVNAAAIDITPARFGQRLDPFSAIADIDAKVLRVLHGASFQDDPTRLFRLARFAGRFGWRAEPETEKLFAAAVREKFPAKLSRARLARETLCCLREDSADAVFLFLKNSGLADFIYPGLGWNCAAGAVQPPGADLPLEYERLGVLACFAGEDFLRSFELRKDIFRTLHAVLKVCAEKASPSFVLSSSQKRILRAVFPELAEAALERRFIKAGDLPNQGGIIAPVLVKYAKLQWEGLFRDRISALSFLDSDK